MDRLKNRVLFWTVWGVSLVLFMVPVSVARADGIGLDKLYHFLIFGFLMYLAAKAFSREKALVLGLLSAYALSIELIQGFALPWRAFDVYDLIAGIAGTLVIFLLKID